MDIVLLLILQVESYPRGQIRRNKKTIKRNMKEHSHYRNPLCYTKEHLRLKLLRLISSKYRMLGNKSALLIVLGMMYMISLKRTIDTTYFIFIFIFIYLYLYLYIYIFIYLYLYIYIFIYLYLYIYIFIFIFIFIYLSIY